MNYSNDILVCHDLAIGHENRIVMKHLNFCLSSGNILAIIGPSGCGKSTLMRTLGGLDYPLAGQSFLMGIDLATAKIKERQSILRRTGFLFQSAALFSSMTLRENIEMPMREFLTCNEYEIQQLAEYKLALVGLADAMDKLPSEISGGMAKRAGIARAMALDPEVIFLDEPSAGLDPLTSRRLDELILRLRETFKTTIVMVSHDVTSILRTSDICLYLEPETRTMSAYGSPKDLIKAGNFPKINAFFSQILIT